MIRKSARTQSPAAGRSLKERLAELSSERSKTRKGTGVHPLALAWFVVVAGASLGVVLTALTGDGQDAEPRLVAVLEVPHDLDDPTLRSLVEDGDARAPRVLPPRSAEAGTEDTVVTAEAADAGEAGAPDAPGKTTPPKAGAAGTEAPAETADSGPGDGPSETTPGRSVRIDPSQGLEPVPDVALVEKGKNGLLPKIGKDGRQPADVYARPFEDRYNRPRIAIVIGGLGLSEGATRRAIERLPADVTLAFAPYGDGLQAWANRARGDGHETVLELPMEPFDYPDNDPGPFTLLTNVEAKTNLERLDWLLSRYVGYAGVTNYMGAKFTASDADYAAVAQALAGRGLLMLDDGSSGRSLTRRIAGETGLRARVADRILDTRPSRIAIEEALLELETIARKNGRAVGVGLAYPLTVEQVEAWAATLEGKGLVLAPLSAIMVSEPS